jgi:predicted hydrolase (HD superfamily)
VKAESRLDKALIASDSLANIVERIGKTARDLNVTTLSAEVENISSKEPWYRNNIWQCEDFGVRLDDFLRLGLDYMKEKWA